MILRPAPCALRPALGVMYYHCLSVVKPKLISKVAHGALAMLTQRAAGTLCATNPDFPVSLSRVVTMGVFPVGVGRWGMTNKRT